MTDSLIRNRETSLKLLLLHRGTLDGSSDEKEGGYEHEIVYASDDDQDTKDGSRPVTAFGDDRGYDVYIRRTETFAGDIDGMVGQGQGETSKGEDIQTLNRTIVSASRRGAASVRSRGSASSSTTTTTTTAAAGIMFTGPSPIPTTTSTGSRSHPSAQQQQPLSLSTTTTTTTTTTTSTDMLLQSRNLPLDPILSPSIPALNTTSDLTQQGPLPHLPSLDLTEEGGGDLLVPEVGREIISSSPPSPSPSTRRDSQPSSPDSRPSTRTTSSPIPLTLDELVDTHHLKLIDPHVLPRRARWLIPV
ncbi:hypothetical protein DFS34DRAFT_153545 [Phlyctochytrium arcticum]|nr:hypothetical protein DFS34DRAFT_153545 [Phlyctochytrium arcticum]